MIRILVPIFSIIFVVTTLSAAPPLDWSQPGRPYRTTIELDEPVSQQVVLEIEPAALIKALSAVSVDSLNQETFAFDRAVLVNPNTQAVVGRFVLQRVGEPLAIDGDFSGLIQGQSSWQVGQTDAISFGEHDFGGGVSPVVYIDKGELGPGLLQQPVTLLAGARYLLEYRVMMDVEDYALNVMIRDPAQRFFGELPHSYYNKMPPRGTWAKRNVLFRPSPHENHKSVTANLEITHSFVGRAGVSEMKLQQVRWRLVVKPDEVLDELHLYAIARGGHRLTVPSEALVADALPERTISGRIVDPQAQHLNLGAARVHGANASAWTIDPALPMKVGAIQAYDPGDAAAETANITLFQGGAQSLVIAVDSGTPRLDDLMATTDLPANVTFKRIATIPVYDGPTVDGEVKGNLIETRYDPMVPINYKLDPDSTDGIHLVVVTITPNENTTPGIHTGVVDLNFADDSLTIPVELQVSPLRIEPKQHFATLVGNNHFTVSYSRGVIGMTEDSMPIAAFHGYDCTGLSPDTVASLSVPDQLDPRTAPIRKLVERYNHAMIDFHLVPQSPALFAYYSYDVIEQGDGLAPALTNWDFSLGFDDAIRTFVIERGIPYLLVGRGNGLLMRRVTLANGKTYSFLPADGREDWVQLPRDQYYKLVADYWDVVAQHLDELGVLDRAVYVSDDTPVETYDDMLAWMRALRERPFAQRIRFGYTIQKTSAWTRTLCDGRLLMDELLDLTIPFNDDHYNFFEPEWNTRLHHSDRPLWSRNVESDHLSLETAGLSNVLLPLKLKRHGVTGWYFDDAIFWSFPFAYTEGERGGYKYKAGPVINPWQNPYYYHGPGSRVWFYPPDPRGPTDKPTDLIIPSYRLTLLRDGIQQRAILEVLSAGCDDARQTFAIDQDALHQIERDLSKLWLENSAQWYLDYAHHRRAKIGLDRLITKPLMK